MGSQVTRKTVERWLLSHGFTEAPRHAGSHRHFSDGTIKITLPSHGPLGLTARMASQLARQIAARGAYDKTTVLTELRSGQW